jgi:hypothetical protein
MADKLTFEERKRQREEFRRKALASFPYAVVQAPGNQALATWTDIRDSGQETPWKGERIPEVRAGLPQGHGSSESGQARSCSP